MFSKISNKCKFYKNKKIFAYFQHAFHIQLIFDTYFIVILKCFCINKRTTKFICFLKFKLLNLALVGGVFQH